MRAIALLILLHGAQAFAQTPPADLPTPAIGSPSPNREGAARALLESWREAQEKGQRATYESLYCEAFQGVRRSGKRAVTLDREGWFKDRARMFAAPMAVGMTGLRIELVDATTMRARFVQTWESGRYRDLGDKIMDIAITGDRMCIAGEDLRSSKQATIDPATRYLHVIDDYVILSMETSPDWIAGTPRTKQDAIDTPQGASASLATSEVRIKSLPAPLRAWSGASLRLYGAEGPICEAKVGEMVILAAVLIGGSDLTYRDADVKPPTRQKEIAQVIWEKADSQGHYLATPIHAIKGDCAHALWAAAVERPVPRILAARPAEAPLANLAVSQLHRAAAWRVVQERFRGSLEDSQAVIEGRDKATSAKPWEEAIGARKNILQFDDQDGRPAFVSVSFIGSADECSETAFTGRIWAVFTVDPAPSPTASEAAGSRAAGAEPWSLTLLNDPITSAFFVPIAALDLDGDRVIDFLSARGLLRSSPEARRSYTRKDYLDRRESLYDYGCGGVSED